MHQCPTCGKQLDDNIRFCPSDGTPLTETAAATSARTPTGDKRPLSTQIELPTVVGQRYKLIEFRGGGGMAKVYRAVDMTLEREVAVKLINLELRDDAEFDARFQREARIASQLADPHIVVVHDFGIDPEHGPFLVMEYLRGQSLREHLQTDGPLPLKAGLQLAGQLLLALVHAHEKGIIHRDIKPDNVFLLSQGGVRLHVRVLDFGIARIYKKDTPGSNETLTSPGAVLGTPRYMSPEQLAGQPIDVRSDLYSTAMVIHEALTNHPPYVGGKKLCELCPEAPPALQDLLDQCLKPNPGERPQSALEVYMRLNELGKASGILLLPPGALEKLLGARKAAEPTVAYTPSTRTGPWSRRRWLFTAVVAALVIVVPLAGWGIWSLVRTPPPPPAVESLLSIKIGDSRDDVVAALGKPQKEWAVLDLGKGLGIFDQKNEPSERELQEFQAAIGHILRGSDLPLLPLMMRQHRVTNPNDTQCLWWPDKDVCVILSQSKVEAVVAHARSRGGRSARGIKIGDTEGELVHAYTSEVPEYVQLPDPPTGKRPPGSKGYRYNKLGIGFEVVNEKVISITLFQPAAP